MMATRRDTLYLLIIPVKMNIEFPPITTFRGDKSQSVIDPTDAALISSGLTGAGIGSVNGVRCILVQIPV